MNRAKLFGNYLTQKNNGTTSAKNWKLGVRFERRISDVMSLFLGQSVEGDPFKGLRQAYNTDLGLKYEIQKTDTFKWNAEGGYRYAHENYFTRSEDKHFIRLYTELEKKLNEAVTAKYWIEGLPNVKESNDWQLNSEASLSALLNSTFSLKTSYGLRYDHEPNELGLKKTDTVLSTALVAKF
jgi:putative salt-induced outer membrane protein